MGKIRRTEEGGPAGAVVATLPEVGLCVSGRSVGGGGEATGDDVLCDLGGGDVAERIDDDGASGAGRLARLGIEGGRNSDGVGRR